MVCDQPDRIGISPFGFFDVLDVEQVTAPGPFLGFRQFKFDVRPIFRLGVQNLERIFLFELDSDRVADKAVAVGSTSEHNPLRIDRDKAVYIADDGQADLRPFRIV